MSPYIPNEVDEASCCIVILCRSIRGWLGILLMTSHEAEGRFRSNSLNRLIFDVLKRIKVLEPNWPSDLEPQLSARLVLALYRLEPKDLSDEAKLGTEYQETALSIRKKLKSLHRYLNTPETASVLLDGRVVERALSYIKPIHELGHYLWSPRTSGHHFELLCPNLNGDEVTLGIVSFAPSDLSHLDKSMDSFNAYGDTWILTRMVTFPWAPKNAASYLVSRAVRKLRDRAPNLGSIITYCDPNLGFSGVIYRALNARLLIRERKQRYAYEADKYVSDRYLIRKYGSARVSDLQLLGHDVTASKIQLTPLEIWCLPPQPSSMPVVRNTLSVTPPYNLVGV